jgi:hypothetical protein
MSNEPRITTDFFFTNYNELPNLPIIKESQIQIYVSIFLHICIDYFRRCYTQFGAYPNYIQIKMFVKTIHKCFQRKRKERIKKTAQIGTIVRARVFNAGLLARSQFASRRSCNRPTRSRFSLVPEQMLIWYPNSIVHCMLHMQPSQR